MCPLVYSRINAPTFFECSFFFLYDCPHLSAPCLLYTAISCLPQSTTTTTTTTIQIQNPFLVHTHITSRFVFDHPQPPAAYTNAPLTSCIQPPTPPPPPPASTEPYRIFVRCDAVAGIIKNKTNKKWLLILLSNCACLMFFFSAFFSFVCVCVYVVLSRAQYSVHSQHSQARVVNQWNMKALMMVAVVVVVVASAVATVSVAKRKRDAMMTAMIFFFLVGW